MESRLNDDLSEAQQAARDIAEAILRAGHGYDLIAFLTGLTLASVLVVSTLTGKSDQEAITGLKQALDGWNE